MPFASVVVPTLGRATLARALESLLAQDLQDWEAIVVDDAGGAGVEAATALPDERIRAVPNAGRGQADARITGVDLARGDVVCWLDDDDWWEDAGHLSLLRERFGEGRFFFRGGWLVFDADRREVFDHDATPESLRRDNTVLTSSIAYPRVAHRELGPLDRELGGYCDWDFLLRLCDGGFTPCRLPGLGVCYSVHEEGASARFDSPERVARFQRLAGKHGLEAEVKSHLVVHRSGILGP